MESAQIPPQRPPMGRPIGLSSSGGPVVTTAVPPLYANAFEVTRGEYDITLKFQQRDPYLDQLAEQTDTQAGQQAAVAMSQLPAAVVSMSPDAMQALWEKMGEVLGSTPKGSKPE